jgi:multidrug efflux pump subunit AcrB
MNANGTAPQASAEAPLGVSGRIARAFQDSRLTPLLALVALLLGLFAVFVTPREEEPQIDVTMANVLIAWPGASAANVEATVALPAEQVLSQIAGIEHTFAVSRPGVAVLTVQFEVGIPRSEAIVRLHDVLQANQDWLPRGLGVMPPVVKPKGIDDVPIVTLTLHAQRDDSGAAELERVGQALEAELKRVQGVREVSTLGGPGRVVRVEPDIDKLAGYSVTLSELRGVLAAANVGQPLGDSVRGNTAVAVETGDFLASARDIAELVVAVRGGKPVYVRDLARVEDGPPSPRRYVWHGAVAHGADGSATLDKRPAVVMAITKKPGENAVDVADRLVARVQALRNTVIPADVGVEVTRDYGATAGEKANTLIKKLLFATASVVALVFLALGRREAAIVGVAVILTLTATLFASWAWGFTLNRVSLFALIFSIGILVDDAIVVVENIHRHRSLDPQAPLLAIIPTAVDEVGGPTILATLTVIAALLPMAFVSGLMGPYMAPIPINASLGMLISLAIAFVLTPWLSARWLGKAAAHGAHGGLGQKLMPMAERVFGPLLDPVRGGRNRMLLWAGVAVLIAASVALPVAQLVVLKMLPFDNKSEFQVVVDMPAGSPVERTAAALDELAASIAKAPEVKSIQAFAGTAAPINFNGLVRQYYLRSNPEMGDLQVNLVHKDQRKAKSHQIAQRVRPALTEIGAKYGASVKVVEVPPGPPVLSPIVAEVYGPDAASREKLAAEVRKVFDTTAGVVDTDDTLIAQAPKARVVIDRRKAAHAGVTQQDIVATLSLALAGEDVTYLHDASKYPAPAQLRLSDADIADLESVLRLPLRTADSRTVRMREFVQVLPAQRDKPRYRKDMLPVEFVMGDAAGRNDSPLYAMFAMRGAIGDIVGPGGAPVDEYFISTPADPYRGGALKWDGEWQITYETFRDMGAAYAVGLVLIYLLVVAQFGSYLTPLVIMAPIPLTIIGILPGHALLGAQFTATSMIGMIALAGIIVRNSILLVDFIHLRIADGVPFARAVVESAAVRAQPIVLTALAAMLGALFIVDDPIFNGLAISLLFGIAVSTLLTLVVIPVLFYAAYRRTYEGRDGASAPADSQPSVNP